MIIHCGFDLHFPNYYDMEYLFMCLLVIYDFFEKVFFSIHYLIELFRALFFFFFLLLSYVSSLYILVINPLSDI